MTRVKADAQKAELRLEPALKPEPRSEPALKPEPRSEPKSKPEPESKEPRPEPKEPESAVVAEGLSDAAFSYKMVDGAALAGLGMQDWVLCRPLDEARIERLRREQAARLAQARPLSLFLPTPVTVAVLGGVRYLIDGRHRMEVFRRLAPPDACFTLCEVQCRTQEEIEELYGRLNGGAPLPSSYYKKKVADCLKQFTRLLADQYPGAVSSSDRPRRPNFAPALVQEQLAQLPWLETAVKRGKISATELMQEVHSENATEQRVVDASCGRMAKLTSSLIQKAKRSGFYLGLRPNWISYVAERVQARITTPATSSSA